MHYGVVIGLKPRLGDIFYKFTNGFGNFPDHEGLWEVTEIKELHVSLGCTFQETQVYTFTSLLEEGFYRTYPSWLDTYEYCGNRDDYEISL